MINEEEPQLIRVLARSGLARANPDWRYHLANEAGRPRCGALLNTHNWQIKELPRPPRDLCERCARILHPPGSRVRVPLSAAPSDEDELQGEQLGLPLYSRDQNS